MLRGIIRVSRLPRLDPEANAPGWLYARWSASFGEAAARAIAEMIPEEPATDLSLRDPADAGVLAEALGAERRSSSRWSC